MVKATGSYRIFPKRYAMRGELVRCDMKKNLIAFVMVFSVWLFSAGIVGLANLRLDCRIFTGVIGVNQKAHILATSPDAGF